MICQPGITPARAGKSYRVDHEAGCRQDHPRTRGEKTTTTATDNTQQGSPPHARGKACKACRAKADPGITPARAGKSYPGLKLKYCTEDHPRTRGEKHQGSVPAISEVGITPARAGKRAFSFFEPESYQDHPRTRGEKAVSCQ